MSPTRFTLLAIAVVVPGCHPSSAPEPAPAATATYVLRLGSDTLAIDQSTRRGERIEGTLVTHLPRTVVTRYALSLNPATGRATEIEWSSRLSDGSLLPSGAQPAVRQTTIAFAGDSAVVRVQRDTMITTRAATPNAFPYINYAVTFFQLPVSALRAANVDSAGFAIFTGGRLTTPMSVTRTGTNRYAVSIGGFPYAITTDDRGVIETVDGARTTQHFIATRQGSLDVLALASAWAAAGARAPRAAGSLSARDTTRAAIGTAALWVDYGRPMTRGRRVWGPNGVLNDTIWRTGANAATQFRTTVPLTIGGQSVPAGTYTLWTLAVPGRYRLIVNKQTGQWGTQYDASQDLARIPMQARALVPAVERFTIAIEPTGANAGVLRLQWGATELSVPVTVP